VRPSVLAILLLFPGLDTVDAADLPTVVLLGDSIRLGYAPLVARRLEGKARVVSPEANGGDSRNALAHAAQWVAREKPDLVHFNAGLHDLKVDRATGRHQIPIAEYEANLRAMVERLRGRARASLLFATTTPIDAERHARRGVAFDRSPADVRRYNDAATRVMRDVGVTVDDLHWIVEKEGAARILGPDGTHFTPDGYARLAEAVADCVLRELKVRRDRSGPAGAAPEAGAEYRRDEADRDARVPASFRSLEVPELPLPADAASWEKARPAVRRIVLDSLGELPPRPQPPVARIVSRELRRGYALEKVAIGNGLDGEVTALLLVPEGLSRPAPAVLWLHSSTPDKSQVITPNTNGGEEPLGEALVREGYVVLSPDAFWHGDRAGTGPAGAFETGREEHESLFKLNLWLGRTLWGMFVRDDQIALDYLLTRPEVDGARVGATGMSMGSTRAWWLAAVDERIAAVVAVACFTRYQNLIAHGQLRQHGVYYFVNGLLRHFDTEGVLALVAPRPLLAHTGELDAGSPADGVRALEEELVQVYGAVGAGDRFRSVLYPEVGHTVTPEMRRETLAWFARWLKEPAATEAQHVHAAGDPSQLGRVTFTVSCTPAAQEKFNLAVAILHSFWYEESEKAFQEVMETDPQCVMGYWGIAMSLYHPLWEPPRDASRVRALLEKARAIGAKTDREREFLEAIEIVYRDADTVPLEARARAWEKAHEQIHLRYPRDHEATIFYGLALLAIAPPTDKTYANQIKAGALLEEILPEEPGHPGLAHYIIHAYDFPELALHGFAAAHAYAKIAPAVPHAQHMPSHIFTRLGDWAPAIESNLAAYRSARDYAARLGVDAAYDEQLHAMDYLEYAYLQLGQDGKARAVVEDLAGIRKVFPENFKTAYAFAAIPARFALERRQWGEAAGLAVRPGPFPWAAAITQFARAYGLARAGRLAEAQESLDQLEATQRALADRDTYWAEQVEVQCRAAAAWIARGKGQTEEALRLARAAADLEDSTEKHPVTPGPVAPARELLGELLLELGRPGEALREFETALATAPNRLAAVYGAARAAVQASDLERATLHFTRLVAQGARAEGDRHEVVEAREFLARHP
jgi:dienelactone hydrolase/lysophospholipase L1-like esterase